MDPSFAGHSVVIEESTILGLLVSDEGKFCQSRRELVSRLAMFRVMSCNHELGHPQLLYAISV